MLLAPFTKVRTTLASPFAKPVARLVPPESVMFPPEEERAPFTRMPPSFALSASDQRVIAPPLVVMLLLAITAAVAFARNSEPVAFTVWLAAIFMVPPYVSIGPLIDQAELSDQPVLFVV